MRRNAFVGILFFVILTASPGATAFTDSRINPGTGFVETVESIWNGTDFDVQHLEDPGPGAGTVTVLADEAGDELDPRLEIDSAKDTWVVYWRTGSTDEVLFRRHGYSAGSWGPERLASDGIYSSSRPVLAAEASGTWIGYEEDQGTTIALVVGLINDDPDPMQSIYTLGATSFSGSRDLILLSENGSLWATWVDSATDVGWSEFDSATDSWSAESLESYSSDGVGLARKRIRLEVLAN